MKNFIKIIISFYLALAIVVAYLYALENPSQSPPYSNLNFQTKSKQLIFPRLTNFLNNLILFNSKLGIGLASPLALFHLKTTNTSTIPFQIETYNVNYFNPSLFPNWTYRRPIIIDNTQNTSTLTDYQILVNFNTQELIQNNKMRSDCGDIRFTDSDGSSQLNYWLGSGCNTQTTKIFVKVPSIPSSSLKTIYVYYGNNNATSQSNPNNMGFYFFDDFEDGVIDSSKWRIIGSSTLVTEINGYLRTYSENNLWQAVRSLTQFSGNFKISMDIYIYGDRGHQGNVFFGVLDASSSDPTGSLEAFSYSPLRIGLTERDVASFWPIVALQTNGSSRSYKDLAGIGLGPLTYPVVNISWLGNQSIFQVIFYNSIYSANLTSSAPIGKSFNLFLGGLDTSSIYGPVETRVNYVVVSQATFPEPTITINNEQSNSQYVSSLYLSTSSNLGLLTTNPLSTLSVNGNVAIGSYSFTTSAPENSLIVSGKLGIGTANPSASLEVFNRNDVILAGGRYGINIEVLTANKTLNPKIDYLYQYLNPGSTDRIIYLSTTTAQLGDRFIIKNTAPYTSSVRLQINVGSSAIDWIYAGSIREYVFTGSWRILFIVDETYYTYSLGYNARTYSRSFSLGYSANSYNFGLAIGYLADAENNGLAVGYNSKATSFGTALGYDSQAYNGGVAVGYQSRGYNYGVSVGYLAGFKLSSSTVNQNLLLGAYAGYQLTSGIGNIILGYQSGYDTSTSPTTGSYNILIGYQAGTPATNTSNFLNIGNLIFASGVNTATGSNVSNGNVGIGTISPTALLHLKNSSGYSQLRLETPYTPSSTNDSNGNVGDITWDNNYIYIKTSGGWKRKALSTF